MGVGDGVRVMDGSGESDAVTDRELLGCSSLEDNVREKETDDDCVADRVRLASFELDDVVLKDNDTLDESLLEGLIVMEGVTDR